MSALRKNVASQVVTFALVNATTGAGLTGATVTTKVTLDGTQSASGGTLTELGSGQYKYVLTQAETNGTSVGFLFTATTAVPVNLHCFITAADPTDSVRMGLTGIANAAAGAAGGLAIVGSSMALSAAAVQAIWDAATSALTTAGSIGKKILDNLNVVLSTTLAAIQADADDIQTRLPAALVSGRMDSSTGAMATDVLTAAALAASAKDEIVDQVWDEVLSGHLTATTTGAALNAAGSAGDPWSTALPGAYGAGTAGKMLSDMSTLLTLIATYIDTEVAAIKAKTDQLTFTIANKVDSSIQLATDFAQAAADKVWLTAARVLTAGTNIVLAKGVGVTGFTDIDAAAVRTAVGLASANLDTQLDNLPTNAELATALATADDATLAAIAALTIPTAIQNADALLDRADAIETGLTPRQALRLEAAAAAGKSSGALGPTFILRNAIADTKDRVTATVDGDGNRTAITADVS